MFNIIPQPNEIIIKSGRTGFFLTEETTITKVPLIIDEFRDFVKKTFDIRLHREEKNENCIILTYSDEIEDDEGYRIVCEDSVIEIIAKTDCGLFYGLQTLKQMLLQSFGKIPALEINDKPMYKYRGFMIDSGRYCQSVKEIKRFVNLMAMHKLNVFHWHLTEDQGWRVEIKKYPELTKKGQKRSHTNFGFKSYEGFFTQEQIKDIVKYCHERFIKVIPEFDIPGHTVSAIACYPYLSCFDRNLSVATHWGVKHDILCAGKESTYKFVFDVLDELMGLFPDKIIHIGGDEAVKMRWKLCPNCQALMKKEGISNEDVLQNYFMSRVNRYLNEKGYTSMMWNFESEAGTELLDKNIYWNACSLERNKKLVSDELKSGRTVVNSSVFPYYFDFPHGTNSLKKVYEYNPEIDGGHILGVEASLWTEYVKTRNKADYNLFPRIAAFCETAWSQPEDKSYDRFLCSLGEYYDYLNIYHVRYATLKQANPSRLRSDVEKIVFGRRIFHWQGLHNLIDDAKVRKIAEK